MSSRAERDIDWCFAKELNNKAWLRDAKLELVRHKWDLFLKEINSFMLNVTYQYCISPATSKGGFSCHPADLSRKCHLCHSLCESRKRGTRPPSSHYKTVRNYFVSQQTELTQSETPPTSTTLVICKGTWRIKVRKKHWLVCFEINSVFLTSEHFFPDLSSA